MPDHMTPRARLHYLPTLLLMAVADVYDALISKHVYKPAFSHEKAIDIIREGRGAHFDPDVVDALLRIEDEYRVIAEKYQDEKYAEEAERTVVV